MKEKEEQQKHDRNYISELMYASTMLDGYDSRDIILDCAKETITKHHPNINQDDEQEIIRLATEAPDDIQEEIDVLFERKVSFYTLRYNILERQIYFLITEYEKEFGPFKHASFEDGLDGTEVVGSYKLNLKPYELYRLPRSSKNQDSTEYLDGLPF